MARLTIAQWHNIRASWEVSPNPGYAWLTKDGGGPWSVSREAVRLRALKEAWRKLPNVAGGIQQGAGHPAADVSICGEVDGALDERNPLKPDSARHHEEGHLAAEITQPNDDPRNELLDRHKREWATIARGLIYDLARETRAATGRFGQNVA